jgi:glyoxylase-like metal-dependent hydrolase (beta-lactamase superfamily II)
LPPRRGRGIVHAVIIDRNTGGIAGTNAYLLADAEAKQAVIFDAPDNTLAPLLDRAAELGVDVIGLWLTHGHFDHVADHLEVTRRFPGAKVLIHKLDEPKLQEPNSSVFVLPFTIAPRSADGYVEDGQTLAIGNLRVEVIFTPGHSPGHVMYHLPEEKILIGGDLIIGGSVGRTDLPDSDHAELQRSIRRAMQLPADTRLLPGHGEVSTLELERITNPFVQEALRG